jgi:hypothetical protein
MRGGGALSERAERQGSGTRTHCDFVLILGRALRLFLVGLRVDRARVGASARRHDAQHTMLDHRADQPTENSYIARVRASRQMERVSESSPYDAYAPHHVSATPYDRSVEADHAPYGQYGNLSAQPRSAVAAGRSWVQQQRRVEPSALVLEERLGGGSFGVVHHGRYGPCEVRCAAAVALCVPSQRSVPAVR